MLFNLVSVRRYEFRSSFDISVVRNMKLGHTILTALLVTICLGQKTKKAKSKNRSPNRYITNWGKYKMPDEIRVEILKQIMENIAAYKRLTYCPYKNKSECPNDNLLGVISRIIADAKGKNATKTERSTEKRTSNLKVTQLARAGKPIIKKEKNVNGVPHVYRENPIYNQNNLKSSLTGCKQVTCRCREKSSRTNQMGYFKNLKVGPKYHKDIYTVNKPFGKKYNL